MMPSFQACKRHPHFYVSTSDHSHTQPCMYTHMDYHTDTNRHGHERIHKAHIHNSVITHCHISLTHLHTSAHTNAHLPPYTKHIDICKTAMHINAFTCTHVLNNHMCAYVDIKAHVQISSNMLSALENSCTSAHAERHVYLHVYSKCTTAQTHIFYTCAMFH